MLKIWGCFSNLKHLLAYGHGMVATNISSSLSGLSCMMVCTLGFLKVDRHIMQSGFSSHTYDTRLVARHGRWYISDSTPRALLFSAVSSLLAFLGEWLHVENCFICEEVVSFAL